MLKQTNKQTNKQKKQKNKTKQNKKTEKQKQTILSQKSLKFRVIRTLQLCGNFTNM